MSAATAATSSSVGSPSQTRTSMVPSAGEGRMSQRISLNSLITPVASMSLT